jgi:hypothetical protein
MAKFCVIQYYKVELIVEAEDAQDALSAVQDDERNFYTVTANLDKPDNDVDSISVWAADMDTEVYMEEGRRLI